MLCYSPYSGDVAFFSFGYRLTAEAMNPYIRHLYFPGVNAHTKGSAFHQNATCLFTECLSGEHIDQGDEWADSRIRLESAISVPHPNDDDYHNDANIDGDTSNDGDQCPGHTQISTAVAMLDGQPSRDTDMAV